MANKTLLIAQREYLETVRTKTFWIGIFIVPVLIGISIGVGALLKKFKEVQRYAVVSLDDGSLAARAEKEFRSKDLPTSQAARPDSKSSSASSRA